MDFEKCPLFFGLVFQLLIFSTLKRMLVFRGDMMGVEFRMICSFVSPLLVYIPPSPFLPLEVEAEAKKEWACGLHLILAFLSTY